MQDDNNYKVRLSIVLLLSIIASILMVIFTIPKANALVVRDPDTATTVNNVAYYGYNIPTRTTGVESGSYVSIGTTNREQSNYFNFNRNVNSYFYTHNNFDFEQLDNYISQNRIDVSNVNFNMTYANQIGPVDSSDLMRLSFSFHPALSGDFESTLSLGNYIDYSKYYSFTFDIAIWTYYPFFGNDRVCQTIKTNGSLITQDYCSNYNGFFGSNYSGTGSTLGICETPSNNSINCSTGNNSWGYRITPIYFDNNLQILKVQVLFNQYSQFKFSENFYYDTENNLLQAFKTDSGTNFFTNVNNIITSTSYLRNSPISDFEPVSLFISQPYDITLWSTSDKGFCSGSNCWTQEDTNNNSDSKDNVDNYERTKFFDDMINSIQGVLGRDYGFSGIVNFTFDYITDLLGVFYNNNGSPVCYTVKVSFFNKDIILPCGASFWNRSDMLSFINVYNVIFIGALSYLLAWKIYKDLLNTFNPNSKIINGNEVDSL